MNLVYYSDVCPDTPEFLESLTQEGIPYSALNINESMTNLKSFLALRDYRSEFESIKANGKVGVPVFVNDQVILFDINEVIKEQNND